ncbi:dihydroorotate dehydrogenase B catalytic subunit [Candidatus Altiarchaeales archaeon WOR_SM1_SCG]|nr:dihydroorotate dehydrogenase B catalytic subunit [Candidatus Altiarchaeales archaeon WOR_SM1_SCG]
MLSTTLGNLKLSNPTILASGILGNTAGLLKRMAESGAGAVTTKSVSLKARNGHENPCVVELKTGLLNAMGLPNPGVEEFKKELIEYKNFNLNVPVIGSCYGRTCEEYPDIASELANYVDAVELNLSCPNDRDVLLFGQNPKTVRQVVSDVKSVIDKNKLLIVKLTPNVTSIAEIARAAVSGGCDIISAINTITGMAINIETKTPVLANKIGGYSGAGIKPVAIRCVYEIARELEGTNVPIIGIGGIKSGYDAIEMLMAGASAVGVGTALWNNDKIFIEICTEIKEFMERQNYNKITDLVGCAVK